MATLSVLKFNDPYGADRVLIALQGMQERQLITLQDAAIVSWPQGNRKPKTRELRGGGAGWGAFWGFLIGMIFFVPFLGAAIGGMSNSDLREVGEMLDESEAALIVVGEATIERAVEDAIRRAKNEMKKEVRADARDMERAIDSA